MGYHRVTAAEDSLKEVSDGMNLDYVCKENGRCVVDVTRRNQCQACRFSKCLRVNMKKDDFPTSRLPETLPADIPHFSPLLGTQVGPLASMSPFKIPLFSNTLPYPLPHHGYFPTNIFYPPIISSESPATCMMQSASKAPAQRNSPSKFSPPFEHTEKPDSQLCEKIKEDEVSSSEEAFKTECSPENRNKDNLRTRQDSPCEPPIFVVSRKFEKYGLQIANQKDNVDQQTEDRQRITLTEKAVCGEIFSQYGSKIRKRIQDDWSLVSEDIYDPTARLLVLSIKWLHGVPSYVQMKSCDQISLLTNNWKELFVLTAAQHSFQIDEGTVAKTFNCKGLTLKNELGKLSTLLRRICQFRLDKSEYDWLKSALLFRTDAVDSPSSAQIESLQEQTLLLLQKHCLTKDSSRLGRIMMLLPSICALANQNILQNLLFPSTAIEDINATLTRILMYTST
ncbi:unnamed protein product [Chilo suppressalis]|uniref:NR LBD domain-containing protein n=1 Tax=Chilo suppressalis TaxID=168631 RepID=A0ABN8AZV6_CHISP|nr:unnamed protein product [Chilo suppressalis]